MVGEKLHLPVKYPLHRIIRPGSIVTMDFSPGRLNVYVDDKAVNVRDWMAQESDA